MPRSSHLHLALTALLFCSLVGPVAADQIVVPASTAYAIPAEENVRIGNAGVTRWSDRDTKIRWYGQFRKAGSLQVGLNLQKTSDAPARLRMSIGDQQFDATAEGGLGETVAIEFGTFTIGQPGHHAMTVESLDERPGCDLLSLVVSGESTEQAHFNLQPRRNAASVHLFYPLPKEGLEVEAFYCEMTGLEDPLWTYYMACGWHRGYFGMQVNSPTERRIIFSVWDSGNEAIDRDKVADENRVTLVDKGEGVYSGSFGNEGTGGHSHLKFNWKTGQTQRFLVTAKPVDETHTVFAGYYFRPDLNEWMLISSWKAPKEGKYLRGLYSFSENFIGQNGHQVRKALYGNQWIRTSDGTWHELTTASFSHDPTGKTDRLDRFGGVEGGQFFLSHGGFVNGYTEYGQRFSRAPSNRSPADMTLP